MLNFSATSCSILDMPTINKMRLVFFAGVSTGHFLVGAWQIRSNCCLDKSAKWVNHIWLTERHHKSAYFFMADWLKVPYLGLICWCLTFSSEDVFRHDPINPLFQAFLVGGVSPFGILFSVITKPAAVKFTQLRLPSGTCWNLIVAMSQLSWVWQQKSFYFLKASNLGCACSHG